MCAVRVVPGFAPDDENETGQAIINNIVTVKKRLLVPSARFCGISVMSTSTPPTYSPGEQSLSIFPTLLLCL